MGSQDTFLFMPGREALNPNLPPNIAKWETRFADDLASTPAGAYLVAKIAAAVLGFFVMSAGPIGFQYAAEIGRPAPESTSQGLLLLAGQASGIAFMLAMASARWVGPMLTLFVLLSIGCLAGAMLLRESPVFTGAGTASNGEDR